ncbi:hypothetical protein [Bradyrhizobium sp. LHD-71]|uniref:hypothetical protein n=1 Tax=Bradyrhizobium sp. LHD-71 TaxID=3072141 RepID=UPI00280DAC68|nr:hypothetical protein [Bradyrhizobium sp. LHD-71]MDQ8728861.1 hypothetical protein [Bradyrhizobium sp. LHD-71]
MLSGEALDIAFALRSTIGPLAQGSGPTVERLRETVNLSESEVARALAELESVGFVSIDRDSAPEAAVVVLAPLQIYLDDLENQGTDDF